MAQLKRYNGTSWETIGGSIAPKNTYTSSTTDTYSCDYVNDAINEIGTIKQGFGDIFTSDGTHTGTLYSNVVGKYIGNGIWEITTDGQIAYSNAGSNYFDYGISITKIGNLLGLSLTNPVSGTMNLYSKYYFYNSNGQIDRGIAGYGPLFEYHSNLNCLMPCRIYNTNGDLGGWPMNMFTSGGYFATTIYLKEV